MRQDGAEPGRDVFADVIDLVCVLARAPGAVLVRLVLKDLHAAALAAAFLSALFLQDIEGVGWVGWITLLPVQSTQLAGILHRACKC